MAKHHTCDLCDDTLDRTISIQDKYGEMYMAPPEGGWSFTIAISIKTSDPDTPSDICFSCISKEIQKQIVNRKGVIQQNPSNKK